jgi:hypothetical protein
VDITIRKVDGQKGKEADPKPNRHLCPDDYVLICYYDSVLTTVHLLKKNLRGDI